MDTIDRSESNLPSPFPVAPSPLPALAPVFSGDLATTSSPQINSRALLRGLIRHWLLILLVWIGLSVPVVYLIHSYVEPTFEAFSILRIESVQHDIFAAAKQDLIESRPVTPYLTTQTNLITSDRVLGVAIADPKIIKLSVIKQLDDPKNDLRKMMTVEPVKDAFLIRVALALSDGNQAASIVNAVVDSYLTYNNEFKRSANSQLRASLVEQKDKLQNEVKETQAQLKDLYAKGTVDPVKSALSLDASGSANDATRPTFSSVTLEQSQTIADAMVKADLDLIKAQAILEAMHAASQGDADQQLRQALSEQKLYIAALVKEKLNVAALVKEKEYLARYFERLKSEKRAVNNDTFEAALVNHQLENLRKRE